ncbi:MAG: hypothetical protein RI883_1545 [Bacteroidota bacterium]|jgi:uncharacterized membrane protein YphA (DoxX/SURF4 family)
MKQKATVQGRSMVFNVLFVILNLCGLALVVIGSHVAFQDYFLLFNFLGYLILALSSAGIFVFQGRLMMANVARGLVGSLFIISGLVKANDPIGFAYKLEEYFEDGALAYRIKELFGMPGFSLEFLIDSALTLAILICIIEIVLGVLVIIGGKIKLVSYLLALMMIFFTFLTWHTASCNSSKKFKDHDRYSFENGSMASNKLKEAKTNKLIRVVSMDSKEVVIEEWKTPQCVSDCGCFGDALKGSVGRSLTPSESLWKDLILVYLVFWIFLAQWIIKPNTKKQNVKFIIVSLALITGLSFVFGWYFPIGFSFIALAGSLWMYNRGGYFLGNHWGSSLFIVIICSILIGYVMRNEPLKDFSPFAEGKNLMWEMNDGKEGITESEFVLKNRQTGKLETYSEKKYLSNSRLWEEKNYKFISKKDHVILSSRLPTISDQFDPFINIKDLTKAELNLTFVSNKLKKNPDDSQLSFKKEIVREKQVVILSVQNLKTANWKNSGRIKLLFNYCKSNDIPFVMITNASRNEINNFRNEQSFNVPILLNDGTGLKSIARANPSILILQNGIVVAKYPHRSIPTTEWLKINVLKQ